MGDRQNTNSTAHVDIYRAFNRDIVEEVLNNINSKPLMNYGALALRYLILIN